MAFTVRDLMINLPAPAPGQEDKSWLIAVGCGPQSLGVHSSTQETYWRLEPVNVVMGMQNAGHIAAATQAWEKIIEELNNAQRNPPPPPATPTTPPATT